MLVSLHIDGDAKQNRAFFKKIPGVIWPVSLSCYSMDANLVLQIVKNSAEEVMHCLREMEKRNELTIVSPR
ncbi:MAG: hypothetical protein Q7R73_01125 [bacterium]|nr:hypothetical protein [bacterium]